MAALHEPRPARGRATRWRAHLARSGPESLPGIRAAFETVFVDVAEIEVVLLAEWWAAFDPEGGVPMEPATRVATTRS